MKLTDQDLIAATPTAPSVGLINFHEARHRLSAKFSGSDEAVRERKIQQKKLHVRLSTGPRDRAEESLYWLISAATLGYLTFTILGL